MIKDGFKDCRCPKRKEYPELDGYTDKQIYEDFIGCGGLYLATKMIRHMNLKKGDIVLDLGCGMGTSSVYLAKNFDITVISVDAWNSPGKLAEKADAEGLLGKIIPLQFDITQSIPFAPNYFDAVFCMNSLFMFGGCMDFLKQLLNTLKTGGTLCVGSECFNKEPEIRTLQDIPDVYNFDWDWNVWDVCYSKYHSPKWWYSLFNSTQLLDIKYCEELNDGQILFENFASEYENYISEDVRKISAVVPKEKMMDQIAYGDKYGLYSTLYVFEGVKR